MNTCIFSGYVTKNAESTFTASGQNVSKFSIAVNGVKKDAPAMFVNCSLWGKQAEVLSQYITKGKYVIVSGTLNVRTYTRNDGVMGYSTDLNVRDLTFGPSAHPETGTSDTEDPFADA
jgi:single-strand DNA-binding protein